MSSSLLLDPVLTPWEGTSSSSFLGRPDGVCVPLFGQELFSRYIFSPYNHGSLGYGHGTHVFGEYIREPHHVRDSFDLPLSPLILCSARIFLGLAEGGLFPGVTYYLSLWYPRRMQAKRIAIFFSAATIAGAFGGILAYGIEHLEGYVAIVRRCCHPLILIFPGRLVSMAGNG